VARSPRNSQVATNVAWRERNQGVRATSRRVDRRAWFSICLLHSHPDHWTHGEDLKDLKIHLRDLHDMVSAEEIPASGRSPSLRSHEASRLNPFAWFAGGFTWKRLR
jgi:hypothetical protein